jgi:hypothetical protein
MSFDLRKGVFGWNKSLEIKALVGKKLEDKGRKAGHEIKGARSVCFRLPMLF